MIGPNVTIGAGTTIGPHTVIASNTTIGARNQIFQFASIGEVTQDLKFHGEPSTLEVGDELAAEAELSAMEVEEQVR